MNGLMFGMLLQQDLSEAVLLERTSSDATGTLYTSSGLPKRV
jgi:hypothetical protein